jgi:serine/threonine protein kinase
VSGEYVAVKQTKPLAEKRDSYFVNNVMKVCEHKYVNKVLKSFQEKGNFLFVFELCEFSSLRDFIKKARNKNMTIPISV